MYTCNSSRVILLNAYCDSLCAYSLIIHMSYCDDLFMYMNNHSTHVMIIIVPQLMIYVSHYDYVGVILFNAYCDSLCAHSLIIHVSYCHDLFMYINMWYALCTWIIIVRMLWLLMYLKWWFMCLIMIMYVIYLCTWIIIVRMLWLLMYLNWWYVSYYDYVCAINICAHEATEWLSWGLVWMYMYISSTYAYIYEQMDLCIRAMIQLICLKHMLWIFLQNRPVHCHEWYWWCSVLQRVAVCCSVLHCHQWYECMYGAPEWLLYVQYFIWYPVERILWLSHHSTYI